MRTLLPRLFFFSFIRLDFEYIYFLRYVLFCFFVFVTGKWLLPPPAPLLRGTSRGILLFGPRRTSKGHLSPPRGSVGQGVRLPEGAAPGLFGLRVRRDPRRSLVTRHNRPVDPPYDSRLVSPTRQRPNPTPLYDSHLVSPIRHRTTNLTSLYDSRVVDSRLVSPTRQRTARRVVGGGEAPASALDRADASAAVDLTQSLGGVSSNGAVDVSHTLPGTASSRDAANAASSPPPAAVGKVLRFFRKRARSAKIGSAESPTSSRTPVSHSPRNHTPRRAGEAFSIEEMPPQAIETSPGTMSMASEAMSVSLEEMPPGSAAVPPSSALASAQLEARPSSRGSLEYSPSPSPRAPFGGTLVHSPSRFFLDGRDSAAEDRYEDDAEVGASAPTATVRPEPEGDLEEGTVSATAKDDVAGGRAGARVAAAASTATGGRGVLVAVDIEAATGASTRVGESIVVENSGIVLPCAPSDEEKVSLVDGVIFF